MVELMVYAGAGYLGLMTLFTLYCAVMHLKHTIDELPKAIKYVAYQILFVGIVVDVFVNLVFATVFLIDLPRLHKSEVTLTARLKRLKDGTGWRQRVAVWSCKILSKLDPSGYHC